MRMSINKYPAVRLVVRHGRTLILVPTAVLTGIGLWALLGGLSPWTGIAWIVAGAVTYALLRVAVEIVQIMSDTLLPDL